MSNALAESYILKSSDCDPSLKKVYFAVVPEFNPSCESLDEPPCAKKPAPTLEDVDVTLITGLLA